MVYTKYKMASKSNFQVKCFLSIEIKVNFQVDELEICKIEANEQGWVLFPILIPILFV